MSAEFVPLADLLRPQAPAALVVAAAAEEFDDARGETPAEETQADATHGVPCDRDDIELALREARLFSARLADAFDTASARLLRELAADVVARELRLAPCDLAALVRRVLERAPAVRVRVAPVDVSRVCGVPVVADHALAAGDAVVELAGGAFDARLGVRLAHVLEAFG